MRRIALSFTFALIATITVGRLEARGFCTCTSNSGQIVIQKCVKDYSECSGVCAGFHLSGYEPNPSESVCPSPHQTQPQPQPQLPHNLLEIKGPKVLVAPCTSQTCDQFHYHNNGEAAAIIPANANVFKTRGYISPLENPNGALSPCDTEDCTYAGFFMAPILRTAPLPLGWPGPSLGAGQIFIVQPFKNWSHNRSRSIQLIVQYTLPTTSATDITAGNATSIYRQHVVRKGQSLSSIALLYYGNVLAWPKIAEANQGDIADPRVLRIGQIIRVPF
jgi:hypothetical protein